MILFMRKHNQVVDFWTDAYFSPMAWSWWLGTKLNSRVPPGKVRVQRNSAPRNTLVLHRRGLSAVVSAVEQPGSTRLLWSDLGVPEFSALRAAFSLSIDIQPNELW